MWSTRETFLDDTRSAFRLQAQVQEEKHDITFFSQQSDQKALSTTATSGLRRFNAILFAAICGIWSDFK